MKKQANKKSLATLVDSKNPKAIEAANYLNQGNIVAGVNVLKALDKENPSVETKLWLASILDYTEPEEAKNYLQQAIKLEPKNLDALNKYGLLMMRLGEVSLAIKQFKQILKLTNDDKANQGVALGNLGLAYVDLGEVNKAKDYYNKALVIFKEIKSPNAKIVENNIRDLENKQD